MVGKFATVILILLSTYSPLLADGDKDAGEKTDRLLASAAGDSIDSGMRVFHQDIMFRYPKEWGYNPVFREQKGIRFIIEYIPKGQALSAWKDMFTIQGFNDLAKSKDMSPEKLLQVLKQGLSARSQAPLFYREIYAGDINGYPGIIAFMGTQQLLTVVNPPKVIAEAGLHLLLKGDRDMYIFHRSWKTDAGESISETDFSRWVHLLKQVKLIPSRSGEAAQPEKEAK